MERIGFGYIRVSDMNGRSGPGFISDDVQQDTIERLAHAHGYPLAEIVVEHDVSGGKDAAGRELGRLIDLAAAHGEGAAIITWNFKRFSRDLVNGIVEAMRLVNSGARLLCGDFDSEMPMMKPVLGLMAGLAQEELDQRREGWRQAQSRAVARGVTVARVPVGYQKGPDGRLVIDPLAARDVRDAFERRAAGESLGSISRRYGWSKAEKVLANRAYLGVAMTGEHVNEQAHEPIVDVELFEAANRSRTKHEPPTGATTADLLLGGLVRCAGCGGAMQATTRPGLPRAYYCRDKLKVRCQSRAFVHCEVLDQYVASWFEGKIQSDPAIIDAVAATGELEQALAALADLEDEFVAWNSKADAREPGYDETKAGRLDRIEQARERVELARAHTTRLPEGGSLLALWQDFDAAERRFVLGEWVAKVVVSRGAARDLAGHVRVEWADSGVVVDLEHDAGEAAP